MGTVSTLKSSGSGFEALTSIKFQSETDAIAGAASEFDADDEFGRTSDDDGLDGAFEFVIALLSITESDAALLEETADDDEDEAVLLLEALSS